MCMTTYYNYKLCMYCAQSVDLYLYYTRMQTHTYVHIHTYCVYIHTHAEVPGLNIPAPSVNLSLGENGMNPMLAWRSVGG